MGKTGMKLDSFMDSFTEEFVKANLSMRHQQKEAWIEYIANIEDNQLLETGVLNGIAENRFLGLKEINLTMYVKPVPCSFFQRMKLAFAILLNKNTSFAWNRDRMEISKFKEKGSFELKIKITRDENDKPRASYEPKHIDPEKIIIGEMI